MKVWDWVLAALCGVWLLGMLRISVPEIDLLNALWSQNMAAWTQAVGSIGALLLLVAVARADRRAALQADAIRRARDIVADRSAAISLMFVAAERLRNIHSSLNDQDTFADALDQGPGAVRAAKEAVVAFPIHLLRHSHAIIQFSHVNGMLAMVEETLERLRDQYEGMAPDGRSESQGRTMANLKQMADMIETKAWTLIDMFSLPGFEGHERPVTAPQRV